MNPNQSFDSQNQASNPKDSESLAGEDEESRDSSESSNSDAIIVFCRKGFDLFRSERDCESSDGDDELYGSINVLDSIPNKSLDSLVGDLIKLDGNVASLYPSELSDVVGVETNVKELDVRVLSLIKLRALKQLELGRVPRRALPKPFFGEIMGLKFVTKLVVCRLSITFVPAEICRLTNLKHLNLSCNKLRSLPKEIGALSNLISLSLSNNKLVELPEDLSFLHRLESLDLSMNRLTSLESLKMRLMRSLHNLDVRNNKLRSYCEVPEWICCSLDGSDGDMLNDGMDVIEESVSGSGRVSIHVFPSSSSSSILDESSVSSRIRRMGKEWRRGKYLQQWARQDKLTNSRKCKVEDYADNFTVKEAEDCRAYKAANLECGSCITNEDDEIVRHVYGEAKGRMFVDGDQDEGLRLKKRCALGCCDTANNVADCKANASGEEYGHPYTLYSSDGDHDEGSSTPRKSSSKSKRRYEMDLENPNPRKSRRSFNDSLHISRNYNEMSFCSVHDRLADGFYDAGRDRPFMPLSRYEQKFDLYSREVILVDRRKDEGLDALTLAAQTMVYNWKTLIGSRQGVDDTADVNLQVASLLALFVSDRYGGSDKSSLIQRARKSVSGSNYSKPFVCTCLTGSGEYLMGYAKQNLDTIEDAAFPDICENSFRNMKARNNSCVIPIGALQFGLCRHRAILMKYLCDRMDPPVPCELVRGYLDFCPHAWNVVLIKRRGTWVRMVVDACRPHDIREEADPEYFSRYTPRNRIVTPAAVSNTAFAGLFSSIISGEEIEKAALGSVVLCKFGSVEVAAKVRKLEVCGASWDKVRQFEYNCLAEVRILGAVRGSSCIVQMYGHHLFSEWVPASEEKPEHRVLWSAILMEHIRGGSLQKYQKGLLKSGETHVPVPLALLIAREVARALKELHSKHIIHRDIKSENILIHMDNKSADGSPVVKLCDFDRAVPLRSSVHSCCIAHAGVHPADTCVGTPRWMAPEMLRAMHMPYRYGLEVDIWSYGCMIMELLILHIPYSGLQDSDIHDMLLRGERPPLPNALHLGKSSNKLTGSKSGLEPEGTLIEVEDLTFLVDLFIHCTQSSPTDRPTADYIYELLVAKTSSFSSQSWKSELYYPR
ncbi:putative serine/threonine-protein kinase [Drosera capensis]